MRACLELVWNLPAPVYLMAAQLLMVPTKISQGSGCCCSAYQEHASHYPWPAEGVADCVSGTLQYPDSNGTPSLRDAALESSTWQD